MIITIEGPTGAGKSSLAVELASVLATEIISCDSRQVYRHLDIGTAKVDAETQTKVKHHLIDIIDPKQSYNAGAFVGDAEAIIKDLEARGKVPILCGGTGLYVRSLLEGLFEHPPIDPGLRAGLRARLETEGIGTLYSELEEIDPSFAMKISPRDSQRVLRGLEIFEATGKPLSAHWAEQQRIPRYQAFRILVAPPRDLLYQKIDSRLLQMLEMGLLDEISGLLKMGYSFNDAGLKTMGYNEFKDHFLSAVPAEDCALLAAQHHRNYAKRQMTWYRKVTFDLTLASHCFSLSDVLRALNA